MPSISAREFERAKSSGRATSIKVQPTGTAVTQYPVNIKTRTNCSYPVVLSSLAWGKKDTPSETWVKISRLASRCPKRIICFTGATTETDAKKIFEFFDDFDTLDASGNLWTYSAGVTCNNSLLSVTTSDANTHYIFPTTYRMPSELAVCWRVKNYHFSTSYTTGSKWTEFILTQKSTSPYPMIASFFANGDNPNHGKYHKYHNGSSYVGLAPLVNGTVSTWHNLEHHLLNDRLIVTLDGSTEVATTSYNASGWASIIEIAVVYANSQIDADWVFVRKTQTVEPIVGTAIPLANNKSLCRSINQSDKLRACCAQ